MALRIVILLMLPLGLFAQRYDYNWVFGTNCGIDFNDTVPRSFQTDCKNFEMSSCISDSLGNLMFYFKSINDFYANILDSQYQEVADSLLASDSYSGSGINLEVEKNRFFSFHIGLLDGPSNLCTQSFCQKLFYSVIEKSEFGTLTLASRNNLVFEKKVQERFAAVKHANGKDWWVVIQGDTVGTQVETNRYYTFCISEIGIEGPYTQDIGTLRHYNDVIGQMRFSRDGNYLIASIGGEKKIDLFDFDRCSGLLSNHQFVSMPYATYGCEFSPSGNFIYVSGGGQGGNGVYQVNLRDSTLNPTLMYSFFGRFGHLLLAPDAKIYVANKNNGGLAEAVFNQYNQNLSVINQPDSLFPACDFQPFSFYLGDSSKSSFGLPNMPNYNLGALSIYEADAGIDTVICTEDTIVKGVLLGVPAVAGVTYSWQPSDSLNYTNIAQPFANPTVSTWYYLTVTDTSIKYSCQSRTDSVFVEVKDCIVGIESPQLSVNSPQIKIYPNPANEIIHVVLFDTRYSILKTEIFDVTGQLLQRQTTNRKQQTAINTQHLAKGLHFLRVELENGQQAIRKIVIQ